MSALITSLLIAGAYVLGSVPFGLLFARVFCGIDPRTAGSGNVGATNVARLCGTPLGVLTLVCDALKGCLPVAFALHLGLSVTTASVVALAAILGHRYPVFLKFRGGKAVATTVGVFIPLAFIQLIIAGAACILIIWRTGFVSAGSLTLAALLPLLCALWGKWDVLPLALLICALIFYTHRENIARLRRGEEKSWLKKKTNNPDSNSSVQ